jgi:hypothetical protein
MQIQRHSTPSAPPTLVVFNDTTVWPWMRQHPIILEFPSRVVDYAVNNVTQRYLLVVMTGFRE